MAECENATPTKGEAVVTYRLPFTGSSERLNQLLVNLMLSFTTCHPAAFEPYIKSPLGSEARAAAVRVGALVQGAAFLGACPPAPPDARAMDFVLLSDGLA